MAVSLMSGFPVVAKKDSTSTLTLSTASHSTTGACKLVLALSTGGLFSAITASAITDSTGGTIGAWTKQTDVTYSGGSFNGFVHSEIWTADCSAAYTSKTVTLTVTGGGQMFGALALYAVTGHDTTTPLGAADSGASTSDASTHLIAGNVTAQTTGGLVVGTGMNGNDVSTLIAQTGTTIDEQENDASDGSAAICFHKTATTTASSAYTVGSTKTDAFYAYAVVEIRAASSGVTGTGAATLGSMTGSATGAHGVAGSAASTFSAMTGSAAGSQVTGTASSTLGAMTGAAAGAHGVAGTAADTLGAMTGAAVGSSVTGAAASTLGSMSGAATGAHGVAGAAASTLGAMTSAAAGSSTVGTGAAQLDAMTGTASGTAGAATITGSGAATLGAMAGAGAGLAAVVGLGSATLASMAGAASGTFTPSGPVVSLEGLKVLPLGETVVRFAAPELEVLPKGEEARVVVLNQRG